MVGTGSADPLCPGLGREGAGQGGHSPERGATGPFLYGAAEGWRGAWLFRAEDRGSAVFFHCSVCSFFFFFLTTQIHVQPSSRFLKVQWHPLYMLLHTILTQF